jgi:hypothetical protein
MSGDKGNSIVLYFAFSMKTEKLRRHETSQEASTN